MTTMAPWNDVNSATQDTTHMAGDAEHVADDMLSSRHGAGLDFIVFHIPHSIHQNCSTSRTCILMIDDQQFHTNLKIPLKSGLLNSSLFDR